jgi:hypothetical protein
MKSFRFLWVVLLVVLAFGAGAVSVWYYMKNERGTRPAGLSKQAVFGTWSTSTSPEMATNRTTMAFLESGEFQLNSLLLLFGKPVTAKVEEKEVAARFIASGTWELEGDRLWVRITQTNQPNFKVEEPWEYKVISSTDKKLVLEKQGGEIVALFREH